jgi:hypothetical protein
LQETTRELEIVKKELKSTQDFVGGFKREKFELTSRLNDREKETDTFKEKTTKQGEII